MRIPLFVEYVCDELCFDAFPYQVLGPGHLQRLAGAAAAADGQLPPPVRPLDRGFAEVTFGELSSGLPDDPRRDQTRERARAVLAPCLVKRAESLPLVKQRETNP